ncbi:MAG: diguanylate cyclase [Actinomycetales bacterium]|nr:diguanylate cyclase [Actinomycetales bacterium]
MTTGVVLPEATLGQPWFTAFALAVAFNTIIYLGLTFSKLIPWPAQVHPNRIRAILPDTIMKAQTMQETRRRARKNPDDPFLGLRPDSARFSIPRSMAFVGGVVIILVIINIIVAGAVIDAPRVATLAFGLLMLVIALALYRQLVSPVVMIWIWAVMSAILSIALCWFAVRIDSPVVLTYAVIVVTIAAPIALSWPAAIASGLIQFAAICVAGHLIESIDTVLWAVAGFAGLVAGIVLLQVRLNNVDNIGFTQMQAHRLATTDPLTGCFTRGGIVDVTGTVMATAQRAGGSVYVVIADVNDMRRTNADYGFAYGDSVLQAAARALRACLPEGDLIARWDGDAFLALGIGQRPDPTTLAARIDEALAAGGVALGKAPVTMRVSAADAPATEVTFERLVEAARPESAA